MIQKAVARDSAIAPFAGGTLTLTGYAVPFTTSVGDFYAILEESSIYHEFGPSTSYRLAGIVPANGYKAKAGIELLVTDNARLLNSGAVAEGLEFALHVIPLGAAADYASQGKGRQAAESLVGDVGTALTFGAGKVFQVGKLAIRMGSKVGRAGVTIDASLGIYRTASGRLHDFARSRRFRRDSRRTVAIVRLAVHMSRAPIGAAPAAGYQPKSPSAPTQPPAASRFGKQPTNGDVPKTTGDIPNPITSGKPTPFTERPQQPTATPNATGSTPSSSGSGSNKSPESPPAATAASDNAAQSADNMAQAAQAPVKGLAKAMDDLGLPNPAFKFAGAQRIDSLRAATHTDIVNAFKGNGLTPTGHFITRIKDARLEGLGLIVSRT